MNFVQLTQTTVLNEQQIEWFKAGAALNIICKKFNAGEEEVAV